MKKFLVIQTAFIGDAILATGVLEKLNEFYPDAQIDYMVRKGNESLFEGHQFIHTLYIWDKKKGKYRNLFQLLRQIRRQQYDHVVNLQRFAATGFLTVFSKAGEKIGFDKNPWSRFFDRAVKHIVSTKDKPMHEIERNNQLVEHLTDEIPARPKLYISESTRAFVKEYITGRYICIAPASVWFTKQLPAQKWIDFINSLDQSLTVYLLGAPSDRDISTEIMSATRHAGLADLAGKLSLPESAALMEHAIMNYVNDSAPMHLASSMNAPVTAVYCSTIPAFGFGPLSDQQYIVETSKPLVCKPCGLHGRSACPEGHFACALSISNDQLLATLPGN